MSHALHASLQQIPPDRRVHDEERALILGWWVARHDEDRYDETTEYRIALFDARTEKELTFLVTSCHERADTGSKEGEHLASVAFDADPESVVLRFRDGSEQRCKLHEYESLAKNPEDFGGVVSEAEKRIRARVSARALAVRDRLLAKGGAG